MDVTRTNFAQVIKDIENVIDESSFLAIDGEFTGLMQGKDVAPFDTPGQYYKKLREGCMNFLFIQFGLCAFKYNNAEKKWTHRAYNFYIFPKPYNRQTDVRFLCQSSSMDFLSANGFDFNKLFRGGIPYLTMAEEKKEREFLSDKQAKEKTMQSTPGKESVSVPIPDDLAEFVNDFCAQVDKFIPSDAAELEFKATNAFMRRLLYQTVDERYAKDVCLETRATSDSNRVLVVMRIGSDEEREKRNEEKRERQIQELDDAVGFSRVVKMLTACGKLVVGHNMLLDMCHVLDQFVERLPAGYSDFKDMLHGLFPRIVDTKYVSSCKEFRDKVNSSQLSHLLATMTQPPFAVPDVGVDPDGAGYSVESEKYHEAGYDAFVTGLCLIAMSNHLDAKSLHPDVESLPLLKPFMNKLLLTRVQDNGFINLGGEDPVLPRDHVFHLTFPREWKTFDIINLFKPIGGVFVSWLDGTSAYVALHEREKSSGVMKTLGKTPDVAVLPYHRHRHTLETSATWTPQSPANKRRPPEQDNTLKRKRSLPPRESKLTRRSIDTIVEEDYAGSPGTTNKLYFILAFLVAIFLLNARYPGAKDDSFVTVLSILTSPVVLYSMSPLHGWGSRLPLRFSLHSLILATCLIHIAIFPPYMIGGSERLRLVYWTLSAMMPIWFAVIVSDIVDV